LLLNDTGQKAANMHEGEFSGRAQNLRKGHTRHVSRIPRVPRARERTFTLSTLVVQPKPVQRLIWLTMSVFVTTPPCLCLHYTTTRSGWGFDIR
jgi:hypothetical protein